MAASEQCGRNRLARLQPLADVGPWLAAPPEGVRILLSPRAKRAGIAITRDAQGRMIGVVNLVRHN